MSGSTRNDAPHPRRALRSDTWLAIMAGILVSTAWLLLTWRYTFDLSDEGYYWYGAQRMLLGEIPLRDFMAYDVGRYAWTAAIMAILGETGIAAARAAAGLFQVVAVSAGVVLVLRPCGASLALPARAALAATVAVLLNLWVYPYYKVFDYGCSILIVAMLVSMLGAVSVRRWFGAGLVLGLAAIIGRNHGLYGAAAALMLCAYLIAKHRSVRPVLRPGLAFMAGTAVGFSPTLVMFALVDGFGVAFITVIVDMIKSGTTNLTLPLPWPWLPFPPDKQVLTGTMYHLAYVVQGLGLIAIVVLPLLALAALARRPVAQLTPLERLLLCAALTGLPYAHHAFSRAEISHLAGAIAPSLLLILGAGLVFRKVAVTAIALLLASVVALAYTKPFLAEILFFEDGKDITVNGTRLHVDNDTDRYYRARVAQVERLFALRPQARKNFLYVPDAPGLYAMFGARMPIWEIYTMFARSAQFQAQEIARLEAAKPEAVFVFDGGYDGREDLRYSQLNPVVYGWIKANYRRVPDRGPLEMYVR